MFSAGELSEDLTLEIAFRRQCVETALAYLRARAVYPKPAVLALYEQYITGEMTHEQVQAALHQRWESILRGERVE